MGFLNIIKLSFHNLRNNKLRTLLTIIVLAVVSFVVIMLSGLGYSLYASINANIDKTVSENGVDLEIFARTIQRDSHGNSSMQRGFSTSEIDSIIEKLDDGTGTLSWISFFNPYGYTSNYFNNFSVGDKTDYISVRPFYEKSNPFLMGSSYILDGRMWMETDRNQPNIWLSQSFMQDYEVGDIITIYVRTYENQENEYDYDFEGFDFTVQGFLKERKLDYYGSESEKIIYINYKYLETFQESKYVRPNDYGWRDEDNKVTNIYASMIAQDGQYYDLNTVTYFDSLLKQVKKLDFGQNVSVQTRSDIIELLNASKLLTYIIFGVVIFISLIIVLLSIGSVANTIKISAEQNRKFFGVMKAIGMKNKSLRNILSGQIVIMTVIAVSLMSVAAYLSIGGLSMVIDSLMNSMFYNIEPVVISSISIIIPFAVALMLIGFVLLFTRSSLHQFSKMDVITVINEVN